MFVQITKKFVFCLFSILLIGLMNAELAMSVNINYKGFLTDSNGIPINKTIKMRFTIYNFDNTSEWSRDRFVTVNNGAFEVILGKKETISNEMLDGQHYIALAIQKQENFKEFELRQKLGEIKSLSTEKFVISNNIILENETMNLGYSSENMDEIVMKEILVPSLSSETNVLDTAKSINTGCSNLNEGSLRYNSVKKIMQYCNGSIWMNVLAKPDDSIVYGSCNEILKANISKGDGTYLIKPEGVDEAFEVYCDMTTDGGGWTMLFSSADGTRFTTNKDIGSSQRGTYVRTFDKRRIISYDAKDTLITFGKQKIIWHGTKLNFENSVYEEVWGNTIASSWSGNKNTAFGFSRTRNKGGGDFGVVSTKFDHHGSNYWMLNAYCRSHYIYEYGAGLGYKNGGCNRTNVSSVRLSFFIR